MQGVGEVLKWLGFAVGGLAIAICAAALIVQLVTFATRREVHRTATVVFFRASQVFVIGFSIAGLGLALLGQIPWPFWIIGIIVLGVPAFVLLRARIDFPQPPSN
jgi:MFS family permease